MATSVYPATGGFVDNTSQAAFIPEIWSDEIIVAYEKSLVLANLVKKMSMVGKKGDTIHIPNPTRGTVTAKAENTAVTLQNATDSNIDVVINKHYEYSRMIEDITEAQQVSGIRKMYTQDAGYALARQVDTDLWTLGQAFGDGTLGDWINSNSYFVDNSSSNALTAYAADTVTASDVIVDSAIRNLIRKQDDQDTPMDGRFMVIPPSACESLRGIDRYVSSDFVSGQPVQNGKIGTLYGVDIYVSSNSPVVETAAAILAHRDTMVLAEQKGVRSQTQYKQEFLGTLYTADRLYGVKEVRPETGFVLVVSD